jgi:dCMP deaminase
MRPEWDDYFYKITNDVAERSTCTRRKVGAIIVKDKRILATGYNGVPTGIVHCGERGCLREQLGVPSGEKHELCRGLHAEQNAVIQAAKHGVTIDGSVLYCTNQPCVVCSKIIINSGIEEIVFFEGYPDSLAEEMLSEANIKIRTFKPEQ